MSELEFAGKVAMVTGGASGIGFAIAELFAVRGASVGIIDIDVDKGRAASEAIAKLGGTALFIKADISDGVSMAAAVSEVVKQFGRLDYAANNAGVAGETNLVADMLEDEWRRVIDIMLTGVFLGMKYQLPHILKTKGSIVNTASGVGLVGFAGQSAYAASKHGVLGLTKSAALEYGSQGVNINAICPGTARTEMVDNALTQRPELEQELRALHPIGRIATPQEIAEAVLWLCSPKASFVSGVALPVDGGYVAQ